MGLLSRIKALIYYIIIISEWIENGEFNKTDKVIIVGSNLHALVAYFLFRNRKKIYYCNRPYKKIYTRKAKWIVFDDRLKEILPKNDYNILWIP